MRGIGDVKRRLGCPHRGLMAIAVTSAFAFALVAATGTSAAPNRFDTGVYDPAANRAGGGQSFSRLAPHIAMAKTRQVGARFVRIPITWSRVACGNTSRRCLQTDRPDDATDPADSAYAWTRGTWYDYETELAQAKAQGLVPVLTVFDAPAYAECDGEGKRSEGTNVLVCPDGPRKESETWRPSPEDFADFMVAVSRKWPWVRHFEVWNEPNFAAYLQPARRAETIDRYREFVNLAYERLNPPGTSRAEHKFVIAGGTSANPRTRGVRASGPREFLRKLVQEPVRFDAYSTHPYTPGGPTTAGHNGAVWLGNLDDLRRILVRAKADKMVKSTELWVTEFSWDSAPPDCKRNIYTRDGQQYIERAVPMPLLTRWISEAAYSLWRQGVSALIWHQLKDHPMSESPYQAGLFFWGGADAIGRQKRGAVRSFTFPFVAFRTKSGALVWGRRPLAKTGRVVIQRRADRGWKKVATIRSSGKGGLFEKRLRFSRADVQLLRAVLPGGRGKSAAFSLKRPRVPVGIQPLGCTNLHRSRG